MMELPSYLNNSIKLFRDMLGRLHKHFDQPIQLF